MSRRILIVDDDVAFGVMLKTWFQKNSWETVLISSLEQALQVSASSQFDLILSDLRLPDGDGIMFLTYLREKKIMTPFIIMTGYADVQTAVNAIKLGAFDYLKKPIIPEVLQQKIELALTQDKADKKDKKDKEDKKDKGVATMVKGNSPVIQRVYTHVSLVAPTKMSVLVLGESGTGKEYIARMIHDQSGRKDKPFIAVDCGSLSMELAPSELFGHKKGSFTSAIADKRGVFEEAKGGTVFLDEVGNLPYEVQKQLLRALQEQKVRPVGSAQDIDVDVRIVAATNEDLEKAIEEGRFRQDLYHRINEFSIEVPPLRDRVEDLEEFAYHFLKQANAELGKDVKRISNEALDIMKQYQWDGNLRELRNVIRRATLFAENNEISADNLPVLKNKTQKAPEVEDMALQPGDEKEQILAALKKARGNKTVAAKLLQIDRKTLYNKMHLYGIDLT
ncbi:MAG: sigma-54-dependent Fis family transcriptional regulator [Bacteroidales bacterium]|nr:sigma-54-dependent Fis family transcriptional regulator [Bacteroidales bacterium]